MISILMCKNRVNIFGIVFIAQCTLVQSAVLRSHVVRLSLIGLSVRPFVTLVDCDHIGWKS